MLKNLVGFRGRPPAPLPLLECAVYAALETSPIFESDPNAKLTGGCFRALQLRADPAIWG
jgi:hypothetical protein